MVLDDFIWYVVPSTTSQTRVADAIWTAIGRAISTGAQGVARVVFPGTWPQGYYRVVRPTWRFLEGDQLWVSVFLHYTFLVCQTSFLLHVEFLD